MDDQRSEVLAPSGRVRVNEPLARPAQPGGVVSHRPRRRWGRRLVWLLLVAAIVAAAVWYFPRPKTQPKEGGRGQAGAPVPVGVSPAEKGDMPVTLSQLGTVTPLATVTVKTQISGYLMQVAFQEGQTVNKGDFLAQIDPRPYQVALEQAQAQLAKDQALLKNAQVDLQRYNTLVAQNSIAKQTRDTQVSLVAQDEATIKADRPDRRPKAQSDLLPHRLAGHGPGRAAPGRRRQLCSDQRSQRHRRGHPAAADLGHLHLTRGQFARGDETSAGRSGLPVTAYDRTGATELASGKLDTIDNQIDTTTGTVKLRAIFDNDQWPCFRTSSSTSSYWSIRCMTPTSCPIRRSSAARPAPLSMCQAGEDGRGAKGQARAERRPTHRDPVGVGTG